MNYKKKNIFLLISMVLLLWISWSMALKETVTLANEIEDIEQDLKKIENAPQEINRLENELRKVRGRTDKLYSGVLEMRRELLSEVSAMADKHELSLKSFPDYFLQQKEGIELTTSPIVLSGDFKDMIQLLYEFERKNIAGKISSSKFEIKESRRTNKRTLYLTLYVQSINL